MQAGNLLIPGSILGSVPSEWELLGCRSIWSRTFTRPFAGLVLRSVPFIFICKGFRIGNTRHRTDEGALSFSIYSMVRHDVDFSFSSSYRIYNFTMPAV